LQGAIPKDNISVAGKERKRNIQKQARKLEGDDGRWTVDDVEL
jgi:hypothetical protein